MSEIFRWFHANEALVAAAAIISVGTFVGTLVIVPVLLARIRPDYFVGEQAPRGLWSNRHPALRVTAIVAKNLLGLTLLLMGIAMLVLPGQGLLTVLIALVLLDFPGKRRLEQRIVSRRAVRRGINWIRRRAKRPPLVFDDQPDRP